MALPPENALEVKRARDRVKSARWRAKHPERAAVAVDRWRKANPARARKIHNRASSAYTARYPEKNRARAAAYRARRRDATVPLDPLEKAAVAALYSAARRLTEETGVVYHVDHIVPLAMGGKHHPYNLQVLTAVMNSVKGGCAIIIK